MKRGATALAITVFTLVLFLFGIRYFSVEKKSLKTLQNSISKALPSSIIKPTLPPVPTNKVLSTDYHIFQSFNNCGPAALSMALSYYGINETQEKLGQDLRPYQNPGGDNDDKSVTLEELAEKSKEYGFISYHRPNGNPELVKQFLAIDIPVIARTWLKEYEDIGHYRVIKGYDDTTGELIQDDSLQDKNLRYSYDDFNKIWKKFNYEYLVLVPKEKRDQAEAILGDDVDPKKAWEKAVINAQNELKQAPDDPNIRLNLVVALYHAGQFEQATHEFEKVETILPKRALWYQIEPIQAYFAIGNHDRVFYLTDQILNNHNRAFSELYLIRGEIYRKQGDIQAARSEFERAIFYNQNQIAAKNALGSLN